MSSTILYTPPAPGPLRLMSESPTQPLFTFSKSKINIRNDYITDVNNSNITTLINFCEKDNTKYANGYFTFIEFLQ